MALNFPDTPALNQTFTANNVTWRWTGTYWKSQGTGASLYIGDSPPANPAGGTMWFESTTGKTYVYYKDADGNQWVELGGSSASTALTLGAFTTSNLAEGSNLYFTTARATAAARSAITVSGAATYDSATGVLAIGGNITSVNGLTGAVTLNTSNIAEDTSLYFTPARARSSITVTGPATYNTATGVITVQGNINSVNGQANAVTLTTTDIPEGTNQYFTTARARAAISATGIVSYDSATGVISLTTGIPRITSVAVTNSSYVVTGATTLTSGSTGYIKLTGTDFVSGSQVYVGTTAASSTTFVSSTEVRAELPSQSAGSYLIYLVGTDGATAVSVSGVTFITGPTTTSTTPAPTTTSTTPAPATVEYLVVAGGGGGASAITSDVRGGGGGGAGGFRTGTSTNYQRGTVYSITIGGGGPGATALGNDGSNGNPSSFDTISSISGGGGGSQGRVGKDGGSGGGGSGGSGGGSGTAGQGFRGGSSSSSGNTSGGGGGGSFGVGADGGGVYLSGAAGGAGTINAITGTNVTYAAGGRGGGGNGDSPVAATVNSGNGGLGGGNPSGGDGGSGIVVIAYPDTYPALQSISAGLAYDQPIRSGYRVYRFTSGTGTITW
jgi:hypothetical protein